MNHQNQREYGPADESVLIEQYVGPATSTGNSSTHPGTRHPDMKWQQTSDNPEERRLPASNATEQRPTAVVDVWVIIGFVYTVLIIAFFLPSYVSAAPYHLPFILPGFYGLVMAVPAYIAAYYGLNKFTYARYPTLVLALSYITLIICILLTLLALTALNLVPKQLLSKAWSTDNF